MSRVYKETENCNEGGDVGEENGRRLSEKEVFETVHNCEQKNCMLCAENKLYEKARIANGGKHMFFGGPGGNVNAPTVQNLANCPKITDDVFHFTERGSCACLDALKMKAMEGRKSG